MRIYGFFICVGDIILLDYQNKNSNGVQPSQTDPQSLPMESMLTPEASMPKTNSENTSMLLPHDHLPNGNGVPPSPYLSTPPPEQESQPYSESTTMQVIPNSLLNGDANTSVKQGNNYCIHSVKV